MYWDEVPEAAGGPHPSPFLLFLAFGDPVESFAQERNHTWTVTVDPYCKEALTHLLHKDAQTQKLGFN